MSPLVFTALLFSPFSAAPTAPVAEKPVYEDQVFLDDKVSKHHLSDDHSAEDEETYVAAAPQKKRGNAGGGGGSGFQFGAFPVSTGGVSPGNRPFGIGLQLGFPTSVTLKFMLTGDQGIVAGLGFGTGWIAQALSIHVDYLYHPHVIVRGPPFVLSWYFGGGLWLGVSDRSVGAFIPGINYGYYSPLQFNVWLGLRAPIGVQLAFRELPIELYLEGVPALVVFPQISFGIGATLGARFYF